VGAVFGYKFIDLVTEDHGAHFSAGAGGQLPGPGQDLEGYPVAEVIPVFGSLKSSSRHKVLGYGVHIPGNVFPSDL